MLDASSSDAVIAIEADPLKYNSLLGAAYVSILLFVCVFSIGCRNIVMILIKQGRYKAVMITFQYVFGQVICVAKVVSLVAWI